MSTNGHTEFSSTFQDSIHDFIMECGDYILRTGETLDYNVCKEERRVTDVYRVGPIALLDPVIFSALTEVRLENRMFALKEDRKPSYVLFHIPADTWELPISISKLPCQNVGNTVTKWGRDLTFRVKGGLYSAFKSMGQELVPHPVTHDGHIHPIQLAKMNLTNSGELKDVYVFERGRCTRFNEGVFSEVFLDCAACITTVLSKSNRILLGQDQEYSIYWFIRGIEPNVSRPVISKIDTPLFMKQSRTRRSFLFCL